MSDKIIKKSKAELHEMLAEAVRNTQPQSVPNAQPDPVRDTHPRKTRPAPKRTAKIQSVRVSARGKSRPR
jgi:hypothetical protein